MFFPVPLTKLALQHALDKQKGADVHQLRCGALLALFLGLAACWLRRTPGFPKRPPDTVWTIRSTSFEKKQ
eukprot:2081645-Pleurochrysis_carterae.AAC.2